MKDLEAIDKILEAVYEAVIELTRRIEILELRLDIEEPKE